MGQPYLSEIRIFAFNFPPKGWALCNGQTLAIAQNQALFSLMGTTYGGDGVRNFQLPNLQGCVPMGASATHPQGEFAGEQSHTLTLPEIPSHTHPLMATTDAAGVAAPGGNHLASALNLYTPPANLVALHPSTVNLNTGGQPHINMQPYQVVNFCVALTGIFPTRN